MSSPSSLADSVLAYARTLSDPRTLPQALEIRDNLAALVANATAADLASPLGQSLASLPAREELRTLAAATAAILDPLQLLVSAIRPAAAPAPATAPVSAAPAPSGLRASTAVKSALCARFFVSTGQAANIASHLHGALADATAAERNSPLGRAITAFPLKPASLRDANEALRALHAAVGSKIDVAAAPTTPPPVAVDHDIVAQLRAIPPGAARQAFAEANYQALCEAFRSGPQRSVKAAAPVKAAITVATTPAFVPQNLSPVQPTKNTHMKNTTSRAPDSAALIAQFESLEGSARRRFAEDHGAALAAARDEISRKAASAAVATMPEPEYRTKDEHFKAMEALPEANRRVYFQKWLSK